MARPFPHTGPGQPTIFVVPALAERLRAAKLSGAATVPTGNLGPVRDCSTCATWSRPTGCCSLEACRARRTTWHGERDKPLSEVFQLLRALTGATATPQADPSLARAADIPYLVGDSTKLRRATGWAPAIALEQTLRS